MGQWVTQQESVVSGSKSLITRQENILLVSKAESSLIMQIFNGNCGFGKIWLKLLKTSWNRNALGNLQKRLLQCCSDSMNKCLIQVLFKHHPQNSTKMTWWTPHLPSPPKKTPGGIHWIHLTFKWIFRSFPPDVLVWRWATLTSKSLTLALPSSSLSWGFLMAIFVGRYCFFWFRNPKNHQVKLVVHPIIYSFFLFTSQVVQDFWTINSMRYV